MIELCGNHDMREWIEIASLGVRGTSIFFDTRDDISTEAFTRLAPVLP
jgi:hypothetical protein